MKSEAGFPFTVYVKLIWGVSVRPVKTGSWEKSAEIPF